MVLKRRQNTHTACIEPKKKMVLKKPSTKADMVVELKLMKTLNDALEEEIVKKDEAIDILEKKVIYLKNVKKSTQEA